MFRRISFVDTVPVRLQHAANAKSDGDGNSQMNGNVTSFGDDNSNVNNNIMVSITNVNGKWEVISPWSNPIHESRT